MSVSKNRLAIVSLVCLSLSPFLHPKSAEAIPAFSRQHKTECSTCHTIYPELNEFGEAFLKNGYVWPGKKGPAAKGGPAEEAAGKEGKNEWAWLSGLPEQIPLSMTATADLAYDDDAADKLDLSVRSLRLQAGGAFRDAAGFFITYNLYTQGNQTAGNINSPVSNTNTPPNNSPNISELFLVWRQALGSPINLKVGRFEPKLSLWKRSNKILVVPAYASTSYQVGGVIGSPFTADSPEDALELNTVLWNRLFLAGGVVDRNGQNHKDAYGHASYKFGGTDYKGNEPEVDLERESVWDFLAITVGTFGYAGRNGEFDSFGTAHNFNDFYRIGGELDVLYKRLHLKGSGTFGRDSNPLFATVGTELKSHAYTFEGEYYLGAPINLVPLFRYEYQEGASGGTHRYIPGIAYTPLQNTKLSLEYIFSDEPQHVSRIALASLAFSL